MATKEAIQKVEKDLQLLEKMQALSFFKTISVEADRRVTRVPGGWIYEHIIYHGTNTNFVAQEVFVTDKDVNLVFNINSLEGKLEELRIAHAGRGNQ